MLDKSIRNYEAGVWAEGKAYFDVAISRYYYCLYQRMIYISTNKGFNITSSNGYGCHKETIDLFIGEIQSQLTNQQVGYLSGLHRLRSKRNNADYRPIQYNGQKFNIEFKQTFTQIYNLLNTL